MISPYLPVYLPISPIPPHISNTTSPNTSPAMAFADYFTICERDDQVAWRRR